MKLEIFKENQINEYISLATAFHSGPASFTPPNIEIFSKNFESVLECDGTYGWFIKVHDELAGYVLCSEMFSTEIGAMQLWIEEISIHDKYQGKGLGSRVLDELVIMFPNIKRFRLEVAPTNEAAKRLYKRKGFKFIAYEQMIIDRE